MKPEGPIRPKYHTGFAELVEHGRQWATGWVVTLRADSSKAGTIHM